ncbi:hypothetical protein ACFL5J_01045 [Thermodesulfobacteriota bacterium]
MKCALCNGKISKKRDFFAFESKTLGHVLIPDVSFEECLSCGDKLLSPGASDKVIDYVRQKEKEVIHRLPLEDFVTATEASEILGISKQAFSKNPKIKRGLIYFAEKGKSKFYLKKSVEIFKEKGNGKFLLPQKDRYTNTEMTRSKHQYVENVYIEKTTPVAPAHKESTNVVFDSITKTRLTAMPFSQWS